MNNRRKIGKNSLKRSHGTKNTLPRIIVFCEGMTEKNCLEKLRSNWRIPTVSVKLVGSVGEPKNIINKAAQEKKLLSRIEKKKTEIWVVFDRDEHPHWAAAINRAHSLDLDLGISNPCVELWALLLHKDQNSFISRREAQRELKKEHPKYDHDSHPYFDIKTVVAKFTEAEVRANILLSNAENDGEPYKNPVTYFHRLIKRLSGLRIG